MHSGQQRCCDVVGLEDLVGQIVGDGGESVEASGAQRPVHAAQDQFKVTHPVVRPVTGCCGSRRSTSTRRSNSALVISGRARRCRRSSSLSANRV